MITTIIISIVTCIVLILSVLFFPKIKIRHLNINTYWVVALIGALSLIILNLVNGTDIVNTLFSNSPMNPIKILILFFSMTLLSIFLDEVGFFKYLASTAGSIAKSNQIVLFVILYFLIAILTVFTSNDIVILTFTPFICYFCKNSDIDPIPYLVGEFAAANTWSMMLIIGNPTNIFLASSNNIDFLTYLKVMFIPTLVAGIVEFILILLVFRKKLNKPMVNHFEVSHITNRFDFVVSIIHLGVCLILLVISSYIHLDMWLISLLCAISLLLIILISKLITRTKLNSLFSTIKRLPYELIPFVLSMFIIVIGLNKYNISNYISNLLGDKDIIFRYGVLSFLCCDLINNIPMSVLFSSIPHMSLEVNNLRAIYATIIGSNIGAFLTPIGALAGIMFTSLLVKYDVNYGFKKFIKYGIIISIPTLLVALIALTIIL